MLIHIQDLKRKNYLDTLQIQECLRNQVLKNDKENYINLSFERETISKNNKSLGNVDDYTMNKKAL